MHPTSEIRIFSTAPQSIHVLREQYLANVIDIARWSEEAGCEGILVYTDNGLVDPWPVAHIILQSTTSLSPLVAVQPAYTHPYTVAKLVSSFAYFYGRRIYLNMVAGGFTTDLLSLNDNTPHDKRYTRLIEYTTIIQRLVASSEPLTFQGEFYEVRNLKLTPPVPEELIPGVLVSGSSAAGLSAARTLGAIAVMYPKPPKEYEAEDIEVPPDTGVRVGIITREGEAEAWQVAHERFPEERKGQIAHKLAMKVSDSFWHKQLSETASQTRLQTTPYWLVPFENYKTFCPYLVGSYEQVAKELARYIRIGFRTFILDIPPSKEELRDINLAFAAAQKIEPTIRSDVQLAG